MHKAPALLVQRTHLETPLAPTSTMPRVSVHRAHAFLAIAAPLATALAQTKEKCAPTTNVRRALQIAFAKVMRFTGQQPSVTSPLARNRANVSLLLAANQTPHAARTPRQTTVARPTAVATAVSLVTAARHRIASSVRSVPTTNACCAPLLQTATTTLIH